MLYWDTCKRPWKLLKIRGLTLPYVSSSLLPPNPVTPGSTPGKPPGLSRESRGPCRAALLVMAQRVSASSRAQHSWGTSSRDDQGGAEGEAPSSVAPLQGHVLGLGQARAPSRSAHRLQEPWWAQRPPKLQRLLTGPSPARPVHP